MVNRSAEKTLIRLAGQFKAVAVVGPRQSGKTTLVKHVFPEKSYVNLENIDIREFAYTDPRGFLVQFSDGAIIDEAQKVPKLFSYLQQILDENKSTGQFILTGSNNFLLQESISQSLAGRIAYLFLLPFSTEEINYDKNTNADFALFKGNYPPVYDQPVEITFWYNNYIQTYIERDVRQIKNITNLALFERFLKLCAGRTGQILNINSLSVETGVDNKTISSWLSILENSFIIFRLQPHHQKFNKRVVKMPKLYFYDTGILCSLLRINKPEDLTYHPIRGSLFENFIISELTKNRYNRALNPNLYFWRDNTGHEIDVIMEKTDTLYPIEIKSGQTVNNDFFKGLHFWFKISGEQNGALVYGGEQQYERSDGVKIIPWFKTFNLT